MHLSDTWAEPQDQRIPAAWQKLSFPQLQKRLEAYCQRVISTLRKGHAMPDMVTLRNEINRGILFPQGRLRVNGKPRWNRFTSLLNPAIAGVYAGSGSHKPKIMLQVGDFPDPLKFFRQLIAHRVHFDVIGYDYYSFYNGAVDQNLRFISNGLAMHLNKPIILSENGYPWIYNALTGHMKSNTGSQFPFTPSGQVALVKAVIKIVKGLPNHCGQGVWWWEGAYTADEKDFVNNQCSYRSLFGSHGNALPAMRVLGAAAGKTGE